MKTINKILAILFTAFVAYSCSSDEDLDSKVGYLKIDVETIGITNSQSRTIPSDYNPKQIAIKIMDEYGDVKQQTEDYTLWSGKSLRLTPGKYTIVASSNGFDGSESGFDIPYYAGSTTVTVEEAKSKTASITCTLANVKVSVKFDSTFVKAFKSANATVSSALTGVASQVFTMGTTTSSAYFPVGNITSTINVVNQYDKQYSSSYQVTDVKARDHLIFKYKTAETGTVGGITVSTDGTVTTYTFSFPVSMEPSTSLSVTDVNPWSSFAYVTGVISAIEAGKTLDAQYMKFEYKVSGATEWTTKAATKVGDNYTATLTDLTPNTSYTVRLAYNDGSNSYSSGEKTFTTDIQTPLENGNLDVWSQVAGSSSSNYTWYCGTSDSSQSSVANRSIFWDSSNPGTTTGMGALVNVNVTTPEESIVHTAGGKAAKLQSIYKVKFAAASLYTGNFNSLSGTDGAKIDFGRPFTARPTQLKGWYKYSTGAIDYCGSGQPAGTVSKGDTDLWSAYIVLTTGRYQLDNTNMSGTSKDFNALLNDENDTFVVAYGALADSKCVAASDWTQFTVDLKYKNLVTKPTHIIIVFSASKYGDYFTGSTSSLLYLDDLELVYGQPTLIK